MKPNQAVDIVRAMPGVPESQQFTTAMTLYERANSGSFGGLVAMQPMSGLVAQPMHGLTTGPIGFDMPWKKIGRVALAVASGGISEAARNIDDIWDEVKEKVQEFLQNMGDMFKFQDPKSIFRFCAAVFTGGGSVIHEAAQTGIKITEAVIEATLMMELIEKAAVEIAEAMGEGYGEMYNRVMDRLERKLEKKIDNKVFRKIIYEFVKVNWDLLYGYPPCVCEQGCISIVADTLADNGNPYVKAIGKVLQFLWPILQGRGCFPQGQSTYCPTQSWIA